MKAMLALAHKPFNGLVESFDDIFHLLPVSAQAFSSPSFPKVLSSTILKNLMIFTVSEPVFYNVGNTITSKVVLSKVINKSII